MNELVKEIKVMLLLLNEIEFSIDNDDVINVNKDNVIKLNKNYFYNLCDELNIDFRKIIFNDNNDLEMNLKVILK